MELNQRVYQVEESLIRKFNTAAKEAGAKWVLTLGEPDFTTPEIINNACLKALQENKTKYAPTPGNLDFRQAICEFEAKVNQVQYEVDEVMVTTGSTEAISAAILTLLNPDDEVIILTPTYPLYRQIVTFAGGKIRTIDTSEHDFQLTTSMLEQVITKRTKAIILTSPNNPTGSILSDESLEVVYQAVRQHQFFVLSDECYNQIVYEKRRLGISKYQEIKDYIIVCQSLSKPYAMPGWRLGYMLASKAFLEHALKVHQYLIVCVNTFIQDAGIAALNYDPKEMVASYQERRDYVYERLIEMDLDVVKPEGAFYMFPSIKKYGLSSWDFCMRLVEEEGVALIPGICFEADRFIRISYCVDWQTLEHALNGLSAFLNRLN